MVEKNLVEKFLQTIQDDYPDFEPYLETIIKACDFAIDAHQGQKRKYSGNPFLEHPLNVALLGAKRFRDPILTIASILHDCSEDNKHIPLSEIYENFWDEIWFMVDSVTDTTNYFHYDPTVLFHDKVEKFLHWGMQDIRCILLKLHDREHNINTLEWLEPHKQIRMSFETQAIYEPLKKLFWWYTDEHKSLDNCTDTLQHYLFAHNIQSSEEFKETLLNQTFFDFDNDTFTLVYKNASRIFWKIDDIKVFEKLIETKNFDQKIKVISIQKSEKGDFLAIFKYKKWNVFEDVESKFKIYTTNSS